MLNSLLESGVAAPSQCGVGPGVPNSVTAAWCRQAVVPTLATRAQLDYERDVAALDSLSVFRQCVPRPCLDRRVHNSRVSAAAAREWTLARCGHHPFADGRSSRHAGLSHGLCACGNAEDTFLHAVRDCNLHVEARAMWVERVGLSVALASIASPNLQRMLFDTTAAPSSPWVRATVALVASVCAARRTFDRQ